MKRDKKGETRWEKTKSKAPEPEHWKAFKVGVKHLVNAIMYILSNITLYSCTSVEHLQPF